MVKVVSHANFISAYCRIPLATPKNEFYFNVTCKVVTVSCGQVVAEQGSKKEKLLTLFYS